MPETIRYQEELHDAPHARDNRVARPVRSSGHARRARRHQRSRKPALRRPARRAPRMGPGGCRARRITTCSGADGLLAAGSRASRRTLRTRTRWSTARRAQVGSPAHQDAPQPDKHAEAQPAMRVRWASASDAQACAAIYAPYVQETAITFEAVPPPSQEMARRIAAAAETHAWLVLEDDERVV